MQRDRLKNTAWLSLVASTILGLLLPLGALAQWTYNNCTTPPQVAYTASPNVLLVLDSSGSMQQQTYYQTTGTFSYGGSQALTEGTSVISPTNPYDPTNPTYYYGLFDTTQYYTYDSTNGIFVPIGSTTASGSAQVGIVTVTPGASTGATLPTSGLSGAVLNWAVTSRIDAALKALIGGKAYDSTDTYATGYVGNSTTKVDCTNSSSSCYLKAQGALRYVSDTSNLNAQFYIRQSTWASTVSGALNVNYPDDSGGWDSNGTCGSPTAGSTCYPNRDLVVSIRGGYKGNPGLNTTLTGSQKSPYVSGSSGRVYDLWKFTVTQTTNVDLTYTATGWSPSSSNMAEIWLSTSSNPASSTLTKVDGSSGNSYNSPNIQYQCSPGTYYVYVTNSKTNTTSTGAYGITSNVPLTAVTGGCVGTTQNTIGAIPYARVRIWTLPTSLTGVVRQNWSLARYGFMFYKGDTSSNEGNLAVYCGQYKGHSGMQSFIDTVQGNTAYSSNQQPWPYNGTPTGEAFNEVYNYLTQNGQGINASKMSKGSSPQDPYYTKVTVNGVQTTQAVPCRQTYIIHMSDGNWYYNSGSTTDPLPTVYQLHSTNLRPDIAPTGQTPVTASTFEILQFANSGDCSGSNPTCDYFLGMNSMKWAAMYGGFNALSGCTNPTYPWPQTTTSFNSATTPFCIASCTPSWSVGSYSCSGTSSPNGCCAEWNANKDTSRKGVPDNFYYASNGAQLESALTTILSGITQQTGSSSAVATVAQQGTSGDLVIRGAFEARGPKSDTADSNRCLWFGHMESFWPDKNGNYDFALFPNDVLCKNVSTDSAAAGEVNCWDAAMTPPWVAYTGRNVFTSKRGTDGVVRLVQFTPANIATSPGNTQLAPSDLGINTGNAANDLTTAQNLVKWVLGLDQTGYKSRQFATSGAYWILGDIVYSTPVVVSPPVLGTVSQSTKAIISGTEVGVVQTDSVAQSVGFNKPFLNWRQCDPYNTSPSLPSGATCPQQHVQYRDKIVYVGANDGMVHAFLLSVYDSKNSVWATSPTGWNSTTTSADKTRIQQIGQELWAYIPSNFLDQFNGLANQDYGYLLPPTGVCEHEFMVDLAPSASTVFFDSEYANAANSSQSAYWPWHTVLMGGERGGGDRYFALDVTDARYVDSTSGKPAPKLLWEYSVFQDRVSTFDLNDAANSFTQACSQNTPLAPVYPKTCTAPTFPSGYWNGSSPTQSCGGCAASCLNQSAPNACSAACATQLGSVLSGSAAGAVWAPWGYWSNSTTQIGATAYSALKLLPVSWSKPYVGRVGLPKGLTLSGCPLNDTPTGNEGVCSPITSTCTTALSGVRNLAFIGGGTHIIDQSLGLADILVGSQIFPGWQQFYIDGFKHALEGPFLLALDIETGTNAFKYVWPGIYNISKALFPAQYTGDTSCQSSGSNCAYTIPYAMSDPTAVDLWNVGTWANNSRSGAQTGEDGYVDSIYVGDMNGVFYGIKLNFDPLQTLSSSGIHYGIYVDLWRTKPIPVNSTTTQDLSTDLYRSWRQPITTQPATSWEPNMTNLRVVTGAGKYENIQPNSQNATDSTDIAKMSLYNLRDTIDFTPSSVGLGGSSWTVNATSAWTLPVTGSPPVFDSATFADTDLSGLKVYVRSNCEPTRTTFRCIGATDGTTPQYPSSTAYYPADSGCSWSAAGPTGSNTPVAQKGCSWINTSTQTADCCEATCPGTCWSCIYDLQATGERVIGKPLIAGGVVFFTSFVPSAISTATSASCQAGGTEYLYLFDYCCNQSDCPGWPPGYNPLADPTAAAVNFQRSSNVLYGVQVNLGSGVPSQPVLNSAGNSVIIQMSTAQIKSVGVNLAQPPNQVQGWREAPSH